MLKFNNKFRNCIQVISDVGGKEFVVSELTRGSDGWAFDIDVEDNFYVFSSQELRQIADKLDELNKDNE